MSSGSSGFQVPSLETKETDTIAKLVQRVGDLENKSFRLPTLTNDPSAENPLNLWYLTDGRLRGRLADGSVVEYQKVAPGNQNSAAPPTTPQYVPSTITYAQNADWATSYNKNGSQVRGNNSKNWLYFGQYPDGFNLENKSMIHFPGLSVLAPGPVGTRISSVRLRLVGTWAYFNSGVTLRIGLHNNSSSPGSFNESEWPPIEVTVGKPGFTEVDRTYDLPVWVGERFRDGTAQGFTLNQRTTDVAFYGAVANYAYLEVVAVK